MKKTGINNTISKTQKLTICSIMTAVAIVLNILEALIPNPLPIPGIKLGLANIVTLWLLYCFGFNIATMVTILRTCLASLLLGTFLSFSFFMSFTGGIMSTLIMFLAIKFLPKASPIGISIIGAVTHNLSQLAVAAFVLEQAAIFFYLPILLIAALPAGILTGIFVKLLLKRIHFGFN